jgi:hypothetical protein
MTTELGLFSPTTIGAINVSNRIVMAPLTRARAGMDGVPSPLAVEYYGRRASAGLIISEATSVSQKGRGYAFKGRQLWKHLMSRRAPSLMSPRPARLRPVLSLPRTGRSLSCGDALAEALVDVWGRVGLPLRSRALAAE